VRLFVLVVLSWRVATLCFYSVCLEVGVGWDEYHMVVEYCSGNVVELSVYAVVMSHWIEGCTMCSR
jgi:hypothetical protein